MRSITKILTGYALLILIIGMLAGMDYITAKQAGLTLLGLGNLVLIGILYDRLHPKAPVPDTEGEMPTKKPTREPSEYAVWIARFDIIDWYQFEKIIANLHEHEGWELWQKGGAKPIGGVDLFAHRGNQTVAIQCKYWRDPVGIETVQELVRTKHSEGIKANCAALYTWEGVTSQAQEYADRNGVEIVGREQILRRISQHPMDHFPELMKPHVKFCPRCDSAMRLKPGRSIWECSSFETTGCAGRINLNTRFGD